MLSYLHGFHAGNFADVHKHAIFTLALDYLLRKPAPLACLDVYAGDGFYDLQSEQARKTAEADDGVLKLGPPGEWPAAVAAYAGALAAANRERADVRWYPGSPMLASRLLRPGDRLLLCEKHPAVAERLAGLVRDDARVHLHRRDALEALVALVPPAEKRGLVLVDPSYEQKTEFDQVAEAVGKGLARWRGGVWLVWYPLLAGDPHRRLVRRLIEQAPGDWLRCELQLDRLVGMRGSGMLVLNPPWTLADTLAGLRGWFDRLAPGRARLELASGPTTSSTPGPATTPTET